MATLDDAAEIAKVHMRSWEVAYRGLIADDYIQDRNAKRPEQFRSMLSGENTTHYVILKEECIVGLLSMGLSRDDDADATRYEVYGIYLHPDYFRQGIGSIAMAYAFDTARQLGMKTISLWVLQGNEQAIGFYQKQGFSFDGSTKQVVYGIEKTVLRMRASVFPRNPTEFELK